MSSWKIIVFLSLSVTQALCQCGLSAGKDVCSPKGCSPLVVRPHSLSKLESGLLKPVGDLCSCKKTLVMPATVPKPCNQPSKLSSSLTQAFAMGQEHRRGSIFGSNGGSSSGLCAGGFHTGSFNSGGFSSGGFSSGGFSSGSFSSGSHNSGSHNSGSLSSGSLSSGSFHSGGLNSGNHNSGNHHSGGLHSGSLNSGSQNSGSFNSGSFHSGSFNSGSHSGPVHHISSSIDSSFADSDLPDFAPAQDSRPSAPADPVSLSLALKQREQATNVNEEKLNYGFRTKPKEIKLVKSVKTIPEENLYKLNGEVVELKPVQNRPVKSVDEEAEEDLLEEEFEDADDEALEANELRKLSLGEIGFRTANTKGGKFSKIQGSLPMTQSQVKSDAVKVCNDGFVSGRLLVQNVPKATEFIRPQPKPSACDSFDALEEGAVKFPAFSMQGSSSSSSSHHSSSDLLVESL